MSTVIDGKDVEAGGTLLDAVLAAANVVTLAQSLVSRETHPLKPAVLTFGTIHGGTATNIIPATAMNMRQ